MLCAVKRVVEDEVFPDGRKRRNVIDEITNTITYLYIGVGENLPNQPGQNAEGEATQLPQPPREPTVVVIVETRRN